MLIIDMKKQKDTLFFKCDSHISMTTARELAKAFNSDPKLNTSGYKLMFGKDETNVVIPSDHLT